jgi:hypothetical protein
MFYFGGHPSSRALATDPDLFSACARLLNMDRQQYHMIIGFVLATDFRPEPDPDHTAAISSLVAGW